MKFRLNSTRFLFYVLIGGIFASIVLSGNGYAQTSKRNLADYKFGGSFKLREIIFPAKNLEKVPIRQFLWNSWKQKQKGYFDVTRYTREGDSYQCRFFIEPDVERKWQVVSECQTTQCPYASKKACREYLKKTFVYTYDTVERIEYHYEDVKRLERKVSDDEKLNFADFILRLKGDDPDDSEEF